MEKYLDKTLSCKERAEDLLSRLTLEEKVNQISCKMVIGMIPGAENMTEFENGIGQIAIVGSKDTPCEQAKLIRTVQEKVMASSRFGIPAIPHVEALSGPTITGAMTFPTSISLGATFDAELVRDMADGIRKQMRAVGYRQALSPVLDIARDMRWGRINETYGNDPTLVSRLGCAFIEGLQGREEEEKIAATGKHFLGYSTGEAGLNMSKVTADETELREVHARPFEAAIQKAGLLSVMNGYSELYGRPLAASKYALTDLLRDELGFEGVVVSDYNSIERLIKNFHVSDDDMDAAIQCLEAGLDVELPNTVYYGDYLVQAVREGKLQESYIDRACRRSLELKFYLGLFEDPYPKSDAEIEACITAPEYEEAGLRAAREAMVLTQNDGILPLKDTRIKIAVIGPAGNNLRRMFSTYTSVGMTELLLGTMSAMAGLGDGQQADEYDTMNKDIPEIMEPLIRSRYPMGKTIYQAIQEKYPLTDYFEGCDYKDSTKKNIEAAAAVAKSADVVILALGGKNGYGATSTSGEGVDASSFGLPGAQEELLQAVGKANPNFIIVHTDARPLVSSFAYDNARAVIEAWHCCAYAGQAVAETISGENNPSGRLQQDAPYQNGIGSYHYQNNASNYKTLQFLGSTTYCDSPEVIAKPFGYGQSYTTFAYGNPEIKVSEQEIPVIEIRIEVTNQGDMAGTEVVQLYGKDVVASVVRPYHELLGFQRVMLQPGETKTVRFRFKLDIMAFRNSEKEWVCEKGEYRFFLAKNSDDESCQAVYCLQETVRVDCHRRDFYAESGVER